MKLFQLNLHHFYNILKAKRSITNKDFAQSFNISRKALSRLMKDDNPDITLSQLQEFTKAFNKETGLNISLDEFVNQDLSKKYPLEHFFFIHDTGEEVDKNLFKMLRELRNISLRNVAKMSRRLYEDKEHHLSSTYVMRLERGDYKSPSLKKLQTLATIYGVPIELFIAEASNTNDKIKRVGQKLLIDLEKFDSINDLITTLKQKERIISNGLTNSFSIANWRRDS